MIVEAIVHMDIYTYMYSRRKFRSQTSNNMDRWKAEVERGREEKESEEKKSEEKES